ncbi:hypothetical protein J5839_00250 [Methanosarcinaceae archaeon]|nr:hypothetical protein [Methanosarcinaceae archaeon]
MTEQNGENKKGRTKKRGANRRERKAGTIKKCIFETCTQFQRCIPEFSGSVHNPGNSGFKGVSGDA